MSISVWFVNILSKMTFLRRWTVWHVKNSIWSFVCVLSSFDNLTRFVVSCRSEWDKWKGRVLSRKVRGVSESGNKWCWQLNRKTFNCSNLSWRTTAAPRKSCPNYHVRTENVHFLKVAVGQWHLTIDITRRKSPLISSIKYKKWIFV